MSSLSYCKPFFGFIFVYIICPLSSNFALFHCWSLVLIAPLHIHSCQAEVCWAVLNYTPVSRWRLYFLGPGRGRGLLQHKAKPADGKQVLGSTVQICPSMPRRKRLARHCVCGCVFSDCGSSFFCVDGLIPASFSLTHFACADTLRCSRAFGGHMLLKERGRGGRRCERGKNIVSSRTFCQQYRIYFPPDLPSYCSRRQCSCYLLAATL